MPRVRIRRPRALQWSSFREPIPKNLAEVTERADHYWRLFEPHIDLLRTSCGESIDEHLRKFCTAEPTATWKTTRRFAIYFWCGYLVTLGILYASSRTAFWWGTKYPEGFDSMPPIAKHQAELGLVLGGALLLALTKCADWMITLSRYELRKVFKEALQMPSIKLFAPYIYKRENAFRRPTAMFVAGMIALTVHLILHDTNVLYSTILNTFAIVMIIMSAVVLVIFGVFGDSLFFRTAKPVDLDAFYRICTILWALPGLLKNIELRRYIIGQLNLLACLFESSIPKRLGLIGSNPSQISAEQFYRIAASVRELRTWVAFPQPGTEQSLGEQIALVGATLASHNYHFLIPEDESLVPLVFVGWKERLLGLLRQIAFGLLPLAGLSLAHIIAQRNHVTLNPHVAAVWITVGVVWIIVSMAAHDPDFRDKIAATKETAELFKTRDPK